MISVAKLGNVVWNDFFTGYNYLQIGYNRLLLKENNKNMQQNSRERVQRKTQATV